jgi:hypothetical protein
MTAPMLPPVQADATFSQVSDQEGRLLLLPTATVEHFRSQGMSSVSLIIQLEPGKPAEAWLTVSAAARMLVDEDVVAGVDFAAAKARILRAIKTGALRADTTGGVRRLNPTIFRAWLMELRSSEIAKDSDDE